MFELTGGTTIDLGPLAGQLCAGYFETYPDDLERCGDAGRVATTTAAICSRGRWKMPGQAPSTASQRSPGWAAC